VLFRSGESGTGKELFAQAIHEASSRSKGPFIAINCGAIPHDLIESELFGYEDGAFSGAKKKGKPGKFELASNGTLFLDEVGELPIESQTKLLRVLEERKIDRLGGTTPLPVDFRLITATNRDLLTFVSSGKFRSDLYYRINEFPIEIPPLREREEDISLLANHFLKEVAQREQLPVLQLSAESLQILMHYQWPGNVRELRGLMRQMTWKAQGLTIEPHHLPTAFNKEQRLTSLFGTLEEQLQKAERNAILAALEAAAGNRALASRMLGIHRTALYKKMTRLGI
jgi:transcriptional regulator with PAS, ATPase and Fis domain